MKKINSKDWKWFGYSGHFIGGWDCRFHMCTQVGSVVVSTVGHLQWDSEKYEDRGKMEDIGYDRKFETFVFKCNGGVCECGCNKPEIDGCEIDSLGANTAKEAQENHIKLCEKWSTMEDDSERIKKDEN